MSETTWCLNQAGSACEATPWMLCPLTRTILFELNLTGNTIGKIKEVHLLSGDVKGTVDKLTLYPARQYVVPEEKHALALGAYPAGTGTTIA